MSRSIHTTHRSLAALRRRKFPSEAAKNEAIEAASFDLRRKQRIKRFVAKERRALLPPSEPAPLEAIPFVVLDEGPHVFHAVTPEEIREVLALLPDGAVDGIYEVRLSLGREYMLEREDPGKPDPYTGRPGSCSFPGVYTGDILGTYSPRSGRIALYAYVVDWGRLPAPRAIVELFLRLQALKTLVHEVAHFHDHAARVRRGRWLADRTENLEWYAEKMEHAWTEEVVVPWLERRYPKECRAFRAWLRQRGGIALPIGFFAGDPRRTQRNGSSRWVTFTCNSFEYWLKELPRCESRHAAHLALAWELHSAKRYDECLVILDLILGEDAGDVKARVCRADTLVHLDRSDEALADADQVIHAAPGEDGAWEVRVQILELSEDWVAVIETCLQWEIAPRLSLATRRYCWHYRAVARCALGDLVGMEKDLATFLATRRFKDPAVIKRREDNVRRGIFRRAGKPLPVELPKTA